MPDFGWNFPGSVNQGYEKIARKGNADWYIWFRWIGMMPDLRRMVADSSREETSVDSLNKCPKYRSLLLMKAGKGYFSLLRYLSWYRSGPFAKVRPERFSKAGETGYCK